MWKPVEETYKEIVKLLCNSKSVDNVKQKEIYQVKFYLILSENK